MKKRFCNSYNIHLHLTILCYKWPCPRLAQTYDPGDHLDHLDPQVIILIVFFVCWFPFFLTYTLSFVGKVRKWEALGLFTFIEAHTFTMREQKGQTVIVHHASQSVCWQQQQPRH